MILKSVVIEGNNGNGRTATLSREPSEIVICSLHLARTIRVNEANATEETIWQIAADLQEALDGRRGCKGDVQEYHNLISQLSQQ